MTPNPLHPEIEELLAGAALGILDASEARLVREHVRSCAPCAALLAEHTATVAGLHLLVEEPQLDPRAAAGRRRQAVMKQWAGWGVAASLVGVMLVHHGFHHPVAGGWIAAGILVLVAVAAVADAVMQRLEVRALREQLKETARAETFRG